LVTYVLPQIEDVDDDGWSISISFGPAAAFARYSRGVITMYAGSAHIGSFPVTI